MSRRRFLRWVLIPCFVVGLLIGLLGIAEFHVPQLETRLQTRLERSLPFSGLKTQDAFVQIALWRGEVRVRLSDVILQEDQLLAAPLKIGSLRASLPFGRLISGDYRPTRVWVSGSRVAVRLPEQVASALPQLAAAESADDYWGSVLQSVWLEPLTVRLPPRIFKTIELNDLAIEVLDPTGFRPFFEIIVDQAHKQAAPDGKRDLALTGRLVSPSGKASPLSLKAQLSAANDLNLALSVGELVPAQFYSGLRFAGLETPERLVTSYRAEAEFNLRPEAGLQGADLQIEEIRNPGNQTRLRIVATADEAEQDLAIAAEFSGINVRRIAPWTPVPEYLDLIDLDVEGGLDFIWDRSTDLWRGDFSVTGSEGQFSIPTIGLPANSDLPIAVREMRAEGGFDKSGVWLRDIELQTGEGTQVGPTLTADFVARTSPASGQPTLTLNLRSAQIGRGDLFFLWPIIAAPQTRAQVEKVVQSGAFSNFSFTGIYQINSSEGPGRRMTVLGQDISSDFEAGRVRITEDLPLLTEAKGHLRYLGKELAIDVEAAQLDLAQVRDGHVALDFRQNDWVAVNFGGNVFGPLGPNLQVLAVGDLGLDSLTSLPLATLSGSSNGTMYVSLGFNPNTVAETGIDRETLRLDVTVDIAELQVPGFLLGNGIENGTLRLDVDEHRFVGFGQAVLDGVPGKIQMRHSFAPGAPWDLDVAVTARVPTVKADLFVPGLGRLVRGAADGQFVYTRRQNSPPNLQIELNLADTGLNLPALAYSKTLGSPGNLSLQIGFNEGNVATVEQFVFNLPDFQASGSVDLAENRWRRIDVSRLQLGRTALTDVSVQNHQDHFWVSVAKGLFDVEPLIDQLRASPMRSTKQGRQTGVLGLNWQRPLVFEGSYFDTLRFGPGEVLRDVDVSLVMASDGLRGLDLNALVPSNEPGITGGRLIANVARVDQGYGLNLHADNLGAAMQALGLGDDVRRGVLALTGTSNDPLGGGPWQLEGLGEDIRLQNVPPLVDLAAAISLTGVLEQMSGSGLVITDLEFQGIIDASSLAVQLLKMGGPSLGLTLAGSMNWDVSTVNFHGAIAPFNLVNQVLGEIPIIGDLFTGQWQEGLFAAQFGVKGTFADPQIEVDPISIVQPGVFRNLVDALAGQTY